jgi:transposase
MEMRIEPYEAHHLDAIIRLSLRAWAPVFDSLADVCQKEDITPDAVLGIIDRWIASAIDWNTVPAFSLMGVDEIAIKKGHCDYVAIVTARLPSADLLRLAVLPDRTKETLSSWLQTIPALLRSQIGTVCTDMWQGYVAAVQAVLPGAALVVDRFHVGQQYRDDADRLRKQELKRLRQELAKDEVKRLKKTLWPFRKRAANLEPDEQERLDCLFAHSLHLKQAYDFREQLTAIFDTARSKAEGMRRIKAWRRKVQSSEVSCLAPFLKLLDSWLDLIANYFRQRQSSGFVEGLNNKLKVMGRRCFGIYHIQHLFQRFTLDLNGYRQFSPWQPAQH